MRNRRPPEPPVSDWVWMPFVVITILYLDPFPDHFMWNVCILAFVFFVFIIKRCPVTMKTLKDANERLDRHRDELRDRITG